MTFGKTDQEERGIMADTVLGMAILAAFASAALFVAVNAGLKLAGF